MNEWISAEDRLPDRHQFVNIYAPNYPVGGGFLSTMGWVLDGYNNELVTHWQPLPDPPEVDDDP